MSQFPKVILKARKARPFFGRHPWVFHGAIDKVEDRPAPGAVVAVYSFEKEFVAYGLFNERSNIRVRLYSWDKDRPIDAAMIAERIARAVHFRHETLALAAPRGACRLVYSEADDLSGLVVDRYADILTVQLSSLALAQFEPVILRTLEQRLQPRGIMRRTERGIGELEGLETTDMVLAGTVPSEPFVIEDGGIELLVDPRTGQKTGAFLDQRDNRQALCRYTRGRSLLDVFCYTGAFGLTAARHGGATSVLGVDVSGAAIALAQQNAERNGIAAEFMQAEAVPALERLRSEGRRFGVVVCDPPKFARTPGALEKALKGYETINRLALELLEPGGILLTCSCSGHVSAEQFIHVLVSAAQKTGRELQLLEQRGQAPDHPISLFCLETAYLKCVIAHAA